MCVMPMMPVYMCAIEVCVCEEGPQLSSEGTQNPPKLQDSL